MNLLIFRQRKDTSTVHKLLLQTSTAVHELEYSLLTANLELANVKTALIFTATITNILVRSLKMVMGLNSFMQTRCWASVTPAEDSQ